MAVLAMAFAGCHKDPEDGGNGSGGNGGDNGNDTPTPTSTTFTVTFDANGGGGTMQSQIFNYGEARTLNPNMFTRDGYVFASWNTKYDGSGTAYTDKQSITISQDMVLYAQWTDSVTVVFEANGGAGEMRPQRFHIGTTQSLTTNAFTRENYEFESWNTVEDGSGNSYSDGQEIVLTESVILYAQWGLNNPINGHFWVDLDLPSGILWANCNVGADSPTGFGDYYAWGETETKNIYDWQSYKYGNGLNSLTKYCGLSDYGNNGFTDNLTTLEASDDAATVNWGAGWRMPTSSEMKELEDNCTVTWTTQNGVNGRRFTASNGNSIFIPAAGERIDEYLHSGGGSYWSSSLYFWAPYGADEFLIGQSQFGSGYVSQRCYGHTIRPVCSLPQK